MNSISNNLNKRIKSDLEYIKGNQKHFKEFAKWFNREDRFEKLMTAMEFLDSYLGLTEPDSFLLDLYENDTRFKVIFDKLYSFHRNISKKIINHKLKLLINHPIEAKLYTEDDSFALSLIDDYKMIYGAPMYKEVFAIDLSEFFTTEEIKKWLN